VSVSDRWSGWANRLPENMRGVGNKQLLMLRTIRQYGKGFVPRTEADKKLCETLRNRHALICKNGYYYLTNSGTAGYMLLRGDSWFEERGL
jgi:hypothetical protein